MSDKHIEQMNFDANTIDECFSNFNMDVVVTSGVKGNTSFKYKLNIGKGVKVKKVEEIATELALALGKKHVRFSKDKGSLFLEVPSDDQTSNRLLDTLNKNPKAPKFCAVLGNDTDNNPLLLRLSSPDVVHCLISGQTGSGKTILMRSMIVSLAYYNSPKDIRFLLLDIKSRGLTPLKDIPHVVKNKVIVDPDEACFALLEVVSEMERRDRAKIDIPKIVIVIDELADLIIQKGDDILTPLTRLSQRGRESGIHLILGTQKANAQLIGSLVKCNIPIKLVGSVASKNEAAYATGVANSGAEKLTGKGDFLLVKSGDIIRFKAAFLDSKDYNILLNRINGES